MGSTDERLQRLANRRYSSSIPVFAIEDGLHSTRHQSVSGNDSRRYSITNQILLPNGSEYRRQGKAPPSGIEFRQQFVFGVSNVNDQSINGRRLSAVSETHSVEEDDTNDDGNINLINEGISSRRLSQRRRKILFIMEPIIAGLVLFPIVVLFWDAGWNLVWILLNKINQFPLTSSSNSLLTNISNYYSLLTLLIPYLVVQILLLILYLSQDVFYEFLKRRNFVVRLLLLKLHIFVLSSMYIVQWEMIWILWDQYTPHEWYFELVLSLSSVLSLIVLIGHLSDLVCAPFLTSYDSIEYCIHFGCPLLTRQMNPWKINIINFVLYEILISNIAILAWRGFYHFLDEVLYPSNPDQSAWICLIIGYVLYFPLMYGQSYMEYLNLKFEFWTFVSINFPQLYRNIRHLLAFLSCLFLWRGIWMLCDSHIAVFESHTYTNLLAYVLSFVLLALFQSSSSINGPMSNIEDENQLFPLYPNCYISVVLRRLSRTACFVY